MSSSLKNKVAQKPIALLLLLTAVFIAQSQPAQAASSCAGTADCHIQVSFGGEYVEDTCEVSINGASSAESVSLPTLSTSKLNIDGVEAGNQAFQIALKLCPANRSVDLRFTAADSSRNPDVVTGNLQNELGDDYSLSVQVRLSKATGQQMFVGREDSVQEYIIPATGEDITHYFLAGYYAKGTNAVTPGQVKATAGIELVYK